MINANNQILLCLSGPTAVGKSEIALKISKKIGCDIISADSMQIYRGMDIGTAKATKEEQRMVKHRMIDILSCDEEYSSFLYRKEVDSILEKQFAKSEHSLLVGGSAFYFDSLLYELDFAVDEQTLNLRKRLWCEYEEYGAQYLHDKLQTIDPNSAKCIHPNNVKRVIRAIEVADAGGSLSNKRDKTARYKHLLFALNIDRTTLYERIDKRVDRMVKEGLVEEVCQLYSQYHNRQLQSLQGIGYKEIIEYLEGETDIDNAIDLIKQHSRNYAKRQITFLKRLNPIWLDANMEQSYLVDNILSQYDRKSQNE